MQNFENNLHTPFKMQWGKSIDSIKFSLLKEDLDLLKSFGSSLGTSDIAGQISTIKIYKENFLKQKKEASDIFEKKSKLYRSIGVLAGAFVRNNFV